MAVNLRDTASSVARVPKPARHSPCGSRRRFGQHTSLPAFLSRSTYEHLSDKGGGDEISLSKATKAMKS
jgi:hypothetical protein